MVDLGKPEPPKHFDSGPMLYFDNPGSVDLEHRLARMLDAINTLWSCRRESDVAMLLLAQALAKQPGVDRDALFADFMAACEAHYGSPHPELVSPMLKTVGWFLKNG